MESPSLSTGASGSEVMSPTKENAKNRTQRPGSRLQELENELAKIHNSNPKLPGLTASSSSQTVTAPVAMVCPAQMQPQYQQHSQTLLTTVLPITSVPIAAVTPSVVTQFSNNTDNNSTQQTDNQDQSADVIIN